MRELRQLVLQRIFHSDLSRRTPSVTVLPGTCLRTLLRLEEVGRMRRGTVLCWTCSGQPVEKPPDSGGGALQRRRGLQINSEGPPWAPFHKSFLRDTKECSKFVVAHK